MLPCQPFLCVIVFCLSVPATNSRKVPRGNGVSATPSPIFHPEQWTIKCQKWFVVIHYNKGERVTFKTEF